MLFDLDVRRYLFDLVLWPQDTIYLGGSAGSVGAGAVPLHRRGPDACGAATPARKPSIPRSSCGSNTGSRASGQAHEARREPWNADKIRRKPAGHTLWIAFSLWTGFTFLGYFTPIRDPPAKPQRFAERRRAVLDLFYGGATTATPASCGSRCKYICPYARFQFVMFDSDTLIITYDGRAAIRAAAGPKVRPAPAGLGDCVDCGICVQVCPTGIDIRDGLQAECIGCAACIDACDQVMDKLDYPRGLIRYSTENAMKKALGDSTILRRAFRPRTSSIRLFS